MKDYRFGKNEFELIQQLLQKPPLRIWWDFSSYAFEYSDHYIILKSIDRDADSLNVNDEALVATLTRVFGTYTASDASLVCENVTISSAFVVNTCLHISFPLQSDNPGYANGPMSVITETRIETICHPQSQEASEVHPDLKNFLTVGLLLKIQDRYIQAYCQNNGYGFNIDGGEFFVNEEEWLEDRRLYEFIQVE